MEQTMNKELAKTIGTAARHARKCLQLTQEDAADRMKVSVEFYARIERGSSLPSIVTFSRISSVLGVSADVLLGRHSIAAQVATPAGMPWAPPPQAESAEIRRLTRRLRRAQPSTLRLVSLLLKEMERTPASNDQSVLAEEAVANGNSEVVASGNSEAVASGNGEAAVASGNGEAVD